MFHDDYAFKTGTSGAMVRHFTELAGTLADKYSLEPDDSFVVELGSNDGTFLKPFAQRGVRIERRSLLRAARPGTSRRRRREEDLDPVAERLQDADADVVPLPPMSDALVQLLGLLAPCLVVFVVARRGWRRLPLASAVLALGVAASTLSAVMARLRRHSSRGNPVLLLRA